MSAMGTLGGVETLFTADVRQLDAGLDAVAAKTEVAARKIELATSFAKAMGLVFDDMGPKTERAAAAQERAAERMRRAWQQEVIRQNEAIDRDQAAARAKELAALKADILSRSLEKQATAQRFVNAATEHSIPQYAAASAAVRTLEGGMNNNVRAAERFLSGTLGLGPALQTLFPIAGGLAFLDILVKMGDRVMDLTQNWEGLRDAEDRALDAIGKADQAAVNAAQEHARTVREQQITNAEMAGPRLGREARGAAVAARFDLVDAQSRLADLTTQIESQQGYIRDLNLQQRSQATRVVTKLGTAPGPFDPTKNPVPITVPTSDAKWAQDELVKANASMGTLQQQRDDVVAQIHLLQSQEKLRQKEVREGADRQSARDASQQIEAARQRLNALKSQQVMGLDQESEYWRSLAQRAKRGSDLYLREMDEANKAHAVSQRQYITQFIEGVVGNAKLNDTSAFTLSRSDLSKDWGGWMGEQGRASASYLRSLNDAVAIQQKNARAYAELALQISVASGQMSRYDALQVQAKMNAEELDAQIAGIRSAMEAAGNDPTLTPNERAARLQQLRNQQMQTYGSFYASQMQLDAEQRSATSLGALREAADRLAQSFTDLPAHVQELFGSSVTGLNGAFAGAVMAPARTSWEWRRNMSNALGGEVRSIGARGLDSALQYGEGSILKHFGFGKADGTQGNPFWVRSADLASPALSPLASLAAATDGRVTPGSAAGVISTGLQLATMIPGFAAGGTIPSNMPAIVGEHGPELLPPMSSPRTVIPNGEWSLGSHYHMPLTIDARGATDPAAVHAAIYRAVDGLRQQVPAIALAAHREYNRNRPGTSRL